MLTIIQQLIEFISNLQVFSLVSIYRNEFAEGADWHPVFPCCFIRMESLDSTVIDTSGQSLGEVATLIIYVAARYDPTADTVSAIELTENLFNSLADFNYYGNVITQNNIRYVESKYGIDIYSIQITVR